LEAYVYNTDLEAIGIIDAFASLIWTTRYFQEGDFELYLPVSDKNIKLLQENYYLMRPDDDSVMIIKKIKITTDLENSSYMTVSGPSLESVLGRRIIWRQTNLSGRVEECIRRLITENAIEPDVLSRKIHRLKLGTLLGFTETMETQVTGDNLLTYISETCKAYGWGFKVTIQNNSFVFQLYKGVDRSYNQNANPYVVFSPEFDNFMRSEYTLDSTNYSNVALVAGEGEGAERRTQIIGDAADLERYELFVDARDVSSNSGEITDEEYEQNLVQRGEEKLAETAITEAYTGEVETRISYKYKEDYFLGDTIQIKNEYGMEAAPIIIEIIESEDENGYTVIPTIATWEVK